MKNIIIYTDSEKSEVKTLLEECKEFDVRLKSLLEIKDSADLNPQVIVIEGDLNTVKNTVMVNKFDAPVLLSVDRKIDDITVRSDAFDFIKKPIDGFELKTRIKTLLKIKQLNEEVGVVATTDDLTGLYNRKYLHERLEAELSRAKRYKLSLSCILIDIDFFKTVNDMYGYDWGDVLLQRLTEIMKKHVRKEDVLTRYGDEEFLLLLPNTNEENAYLFAERLRRDVEKMEFIPADEEEKHQVTVSGGIASYPYLENCDESANTLIRYAEHSLYNAKKRGKNKMVQFSQINMEI